MNIFLFGAFVSLATLAPSLCITLTPIAENIYFWPSGRGPIGNYGVSRFPAIADISKPTWSWHSEKGRWANIPVGTCLDDKKNIYLTLADGMKKFSPDGNLLWTYTRSLEDEVINNAASISNGMAFGITSKSRAFALNMQTGKEIWSKIIGTGNDGNFGQVSAHDGVVITATNQTGGSNSVVVGLNEVDGSILWTYKPEVSLWNFEVSFPGDGTFVFQDLAGGPHRCMMKDGSLIWKQDGIKDSWTDGQTTVGPNGVVYAVSNYNHGQPIPGYEGVGLLRAFRLSDGKLLWNVSTPRPPNDVPVVGQLAGHTGLSVVLPMGQQCKQGEQIDVRAYNAETGELQWTFEGPKQLGPEVAGDLEGIPARAASHIQTMTKPNPWGQAAIDATGIVYVGGETGHFFALRDSNSDGHVFGDNEISVFETGAAFVGSSGPALAPGLLAVGAQDSLHVWQWPV